MNDFIVCRVGRRITVWAFIWLKVGGNFLATFAPGVMVFSTGRFLIGLGNAGSFIIAFVLGENLRRDSNCKVCYQVVTQSKKARFTGI